MIKISYYNYHAIFYDWVVEMNSILSSLYNYAMEDTDQRFLTQDELRDYGSARRSEEKQRGRLEEVLEVEPLRLFELYADNSEEVRYYANISAFRKGLAIGLKLGAFAMPDV